MSTANSSNSSGGLFVLVALAFGGWYYWKTVQANPPLGPEVSRLVQRMNSQRVTAEDLVRQINNRPPGRAISPSGRLQLERLYQEAQVRYDELIAGASEDILNGTERLGGIEPLLQAASQAGERFIAHANHVLEYGDVSDSGGAKISPSTILEIAQKAADEYRASNRKQREAAVRMLERNRWPAFADVR